MTAYAIGQLAGMQKQAFSTRQIKRMLSALKGKALPDVPGLRELAAGVASGKSVGHKSLIEPRMRARAHMMFGKNLPKEELNQYANINRSPAWYRKHYGTEHVLQGRRIHRIAQANPYLAGQRRAVAKRGLKDVPKNIASREERLFPDLEKGIIHPVVSRPGEMPTNRYANELKYQMEQIKKWRASPNPEAKEWIADLEQKFLGQKIDPGALWRGSSIHDYGVPEGKQIWSALRPDVAASFVHGPRAMATGKIKMPVVSSGLLSKLKANKWPLEYPERYWGKDEFSEFVLKHPGAKALMERVEEPYRVIGGKYIKLSPRSLKRWARAVGYEV